MHCSFTSIPRLEISMLTQRLLQPVWELILSKCGVLVSFWLFPLILQSTVYMGTALYFTVTKDIGPLRSEKTRIHTDFWPTLRKIINVGAIQVLGYVALDTLLWFALPYFVVLPEEAPTLLEFARDLTTAVIIGDFLMFVYHVVNHKVKYFYKYVHYIHHQVKSDMFSWSTGWAHPFEGIAIVFLMFLYPWILFPVHPLTLWTYVCITVPFFVEEHSGHNVWWSPHNWVPSMFSGAVSHEVHHMKIKYNYGVIFNIWDKALGTYLPPSKSTN